MRLRKAEVWTTYKATYHEQVKTGPYAIRNRKGTHKNDDYAWKKTFSTAESHGIDKKAEKILKELSAQDRARVEQARVQFNKDIQNGDIEAAVENLMDNAAALVRRVPGYRKAFENFDLMYKAIQRINNAHVDMNDDKAVDALFSSVMRDIQKARPDIRFVDTSAEELREEFNLASLVNGLDAKEPPLDLATDITIDLMLKTRGVTTILPKASHHTHFTVPLWQLPARFMQAQQAAGIAPEKPPLYGMTVEMFAGDKQSFRLRLEGHDPATIHQTLRETLQADERFINAPADAQYQASFYQALGRKPRMFLSGRHAGGTDALGEAYIYAHRTGVVPEPKGQWIPRLFRSMP